MHNLNLTITFKTVILFLALIGLFGCSNTNKAGDIFYKKIYTERTGDSSPLYRADGKFKGNDVYVKNRNSPILDEGIFALLVDPNTNVIIQTMSYEEYTNNIAKPLQKNPSMQVKNPVDIPTYLKLVEEAKSLNISEDSIGMQSSLKSTYQCVAQFITTQSVLDECTKTAKRMIDSKKKFEKSVADMQKNQEAQLTRGQISLRLDYPSSPCVVKNSMGECVIRDGSSTTWSATIRNNTTRTVKDFSVSCKIMASSGTVLSNQTAIVYEILKPSEQKRIKFDLYDVNQMKSTSCNISKWVELN